MCCMMCIVTVESMSRKGLAALMRKTSIIMLMASRLRKTAASVPLAPHWYLHVARVGNTNITVL